MERIKLGTRKVSIEFPGVKALTDVDFEVTTGEIHALVGANGAGKSTLMKVLAGANPDYTGEVYLNGDTVELRSTLAAKKLGIQIVYQEVDMALIPTLSVAENVMLNDTVMHGKTIMNWRSLYKRAAEVLQRLNIDVDVHKLVQDLSLAQKQMVLMRFAGIDNINDIEKYKGSGLFVHRKDAIPLKENEYFIADLIGLSVKGDDGREFGKLTEVLQTGSNDVYVVQGEGREWLFPAIPDCVQSVDPEGGKMVVHMMEGLRDL